MRRVGTERYTVVRDGGMRALSADFDFTERGTRVHLTASLQMERDLTPVRLAASGNSYRIFWVDTRVSVRDRLAAVVAKGESSTVRLPTPFFAVDGYAPLSVQMMLIRYWKRHGRPHALSAVPGDPTHSVVIEERGQDTIDARGARVRLHRYSVDGVVWGQESVWLDDADRLAAITTTAGLLPFEGIREEYADALQTLVSRAIEDRMADAKRLMASVRPTASDNVALVGATVIDGNGGPPITDGVVVIASGRIAAVGPRATTSVPAAVRRLDVRGMTIIPGLWDSHAHASQIEWGPAYLGAGVTTIRDMGGEFEFLRRFRDAIADGRALGPRMLLAGLVDGSSPDAFGVDTAATPDQATAEVRRYNDAGFRQIKIYNSVKPDILGDLTRAAHTLGMTVTGHIPFGMTVRAAVDSGMDQVAHQPIHVDTASDSGRAAIAYFASRHLLVDPTLSWNELIGRSAQEPIAHFQPSVASLPFPVRELILSIRPSSDDTSTAHAKVRQQAIAVRILREAGLPIVAGTDKGVPAYSVPRELEIYVSGGFTPMEALQAATSVPARALGLGGELGTIEAGKRADLVVLRANPLDAISNVRKVRYVVTHGRVYEPSQLLESVGFGT